MAAGACDCLTKPFSVTDLPARIEAALKTATTSGWLPGIAAGLRTASAVHDHDGRLNMLGEHAVLQPPGEVGERARTRLPPPTPQSGQAK